MDDDLDEDPDELSDGGNLEEDQQQPGSPG